MRSGSGWSSVWGLTKRRIEQKRPDYVAHATAVGGRNGHVETSDGLLKADLSIPKSIGGPGEQGACNPEQFFAASNCNHRPEMVQPAPDGLIGDEDPTFRQ
ncbi:hypothetical protein [Methylocella sp.]|jgi:hypothetical protein|uniref:hypothetical protein n=1 Tax=Methylocella sp. TaxID=1978226 RepID=UPI003C7628BB